jgi:hypothetical protein
MKLFINLVYDGSIAWNTVLEHLSTIPPSDIFVASNSPVVSDGNHTIHNQIINISAGLDAHARALHRNSVEMFKQSLSGLDCTHCYCVSASALIRGELPIKQILANPIETNFLNSPTRYSYDNYIGDLPTASRLSNIWRFYKSINYTVQQNYYLNSFEKEQNMGFESWIWRFWVENQNIKYRWTAWE